MEEILKRLQRKYEPYNKEREDEEGMIDVALACELADSVPYLIKTIRELRTENEKLKEEQT